MSILQDHVSGAYASGLLNDPSIFAQRSKFADINNDGHLDAFTCHEDGPKNIWANDGTGSLAQLGPIP